MLRNIKVCVSDAPVTDSTLLKRGELTSQTASLAGDPILYSSASKMEDLPMLPSMVSCMARILDFNDHSSPGGDGPPSILVTFQCFQGTALEGQQRMGKVG